MVKMETAPEVIDALRSRYYDNGNSYAFLEQVSNGTGYHISRYADAIAISLWESRGYEITGFEVKVSRQDWLRELKNPGKADDIAKYCNSWYLVLGDADILKFGELPMNWGLMVPHTKRSLKVVKPAVRNLNPKPIDLPFMCAILRRATQQVTDKSLLRKEYERGILKGREDKEKEMEDQVEYWKDQKDSLNNIISEFEKASGIDIKHGWQWGPERSKRVGEIVKLVLNGTYKRELVELERMKQSALNIVDVVQKEIEKHKDLDDTL